MADRHDKENRPFNPRLRPCDPATSWNLPVSKKYVPTTVHTFQSVVLTPSLLSSNVMLEVEQTPSLAMEGTLGELSEHSAGFIH